MATSPQPALGAHDAVGRMVARADAIEAPLSLRCLSQLLRATVHY
jgi:hypothetical protein